MRRVAAWALVGLGGPVAITLVVSYFAARWFYAPKAGDWLDRRVGFALTMIILVAIWVGILGLIWLIDSKREERLPLAHQYGPSKTRGGKRRGQRG
jgi:hypothetical protein